MKNIKTLPTLTRAFLLATTVVFAARHASAVGGLYLTDVTVFGADAAGSWAGQPNIWETRPNGNFNIWIQSGASGGTFLNGPSDGTVQPNIQLNQGITSFIFLAAPGRDNEHFGMNLFFNGANTPSISVFTPMLTTAGQTHSFSFDAADNTASPTVSSIPGAGALDFTSGNQTITLTDFYWATPSVFGLDLTGQTTVGADGTLDYTGGITLNIQPIPEPTTFSFVLTSAITILGGKKLFRRQLNSAPKV